MPDQPRTAPARSSAAHALAQLEPEGLAPDGPNWQQLKSSQTRIAVLDAAIQCLARYGYTRTTTQMIAQTANISRGAMLHHYANKLELISAVIDYVFYKRMEMLADRIAELTERERVAEILGVEVVWAIYQSEVYQAYLELLIASRTDEELRPIFLPKAQRFDRIRREQTVLVFPEWDGDVDLLNHAIDLVEGLIEGLILNAEIWQSPQRLASVRGILSTLLPMIREGKLTFPKPAAARVVAVSPPARARSQSSPR